MFGSTGSCSDQRSWRSPLSASIRTIGESASSERAIFVMCGAADRSRSRPATRVRIFAPGLQPSFSFHAVGSMCTSPIDGIASRSMSTRRPVSLSGSGFVKKSFGNGKRHFVGSSQSHRSAAERSSAGS
jgi:hypothetical protein